MVRYIQSDDEIYHARTKGSKNGVRRYQYKDGTYTEEGKRRRREQYKEFLDTSLTQNINPKKGKISPAEKIAKDTKNIVTETSNVTKVLANLNREKARGDYSSMSDDELRSRINRLNLERQYDQLTTQNTKNGYDKANEILSTVGSAVTIAGSVFAIAATLHNWNK